MPFPVLSGISQTFAWVSQSLGQIAYVLLTRSPLGVQVLLARLACIRHAASVHPEPGSNSQMFYLILVFPSSKIIWFSLTFQLLTLLFILLLSFQRSSAFLSSRLRQAFKS